MKDKPSVSRPEIDPTSTLRKGENGKIYEKLDNGKERTLNHIYNFTRGISDLDPNGTPEQNVIRRDGFPNIIKKDQPPEAQPPEAPPPEAPQTDARCVLYLVYKSVSQSEEGVPAEPKIN